MVFNVACDLQLQFLNHKNKDSNFLHKRKNWYKIHKRHINHWMFGLEYCPGTQTGTNGRLREPLLESLT